LIDRGIELFWGSSKARTIPVCRWCGRAPGGEAEGADWMNSRGEPEVIQGRSLSAGNKTNSFCFVGGAAEGIGVDFEVCPEPF
jgi:hypothetical protein